ncbi:MAG: glycosyltransferase family 4 protein [Chlamydiales bacterium]
MAKHVFLLKSGAARPGGLEKMSQRLAHAFETKGCEVTLVTSGSKIDSSSSIHTISFAPRSVLSFRKALEFDRFCEKTMREVHPDIIFGMDRNRHQTHLRAGNGVHAAYLAQRSLVDPFYKRWSFALNPLHQTLLKIEKEAFENPALRILFTNSEMVKKEILHYYNVDPRKIHVVHNGVEWKECEKEFLSWKEKKSGIAKELGLDPEVFHFLFIGHNFRRKGVDKLLRGLAHLNTRGFHLSVVGEDKNRADFAHLAHQLGLKKQVSFFGVQSEIARFYQLADALVIPSLYDPFANVTLEGLAMGLFVVSSKTNGGHEVLNEASGVKIGQLSEVESISSALATALSHPKNETSAKKIRESVKHLDFSQKLDEIVDQCLL